MKWEQLRTVRPIIGIGDIVADLIVRVPALPVQADDFHLASDFELEAGGTANFLIMAARLGAPVLALGSIGEDLWGAEINRILNTERINMQEVSTSETTTRALVLVDEAGRHAFIGKFGEGDLQPLSPHQRNLLGSAGAVFASGYSLSEQHLADFTLDAFTTAGKARVPRGFDPGPAFPGLAESLRAETLRHTDVLLVTEDELPVVSPEGLDRLLGLGIQVIVLKRGAEGCHVYTTDGLAADIPGHAVEVCDTTAAGDSFAAGFLAAMAAGWTLDECARLANAVGAAKVRKLGGGRNVPLLREVRALL